MAKKITTTIITILAALLVFAGCSKDNSTDNTTDTTIQSEEISFKAEDLILAYCNGTWDGQFISNTEHCASIEDGILWVDCKSTERIPDMGPLDDTTYCNEAIDISADGTWIYNYESEILELWYKGFRKEVFSVYTDSRYGTSVYKINDGFVVHCGASLRLLNEFGATTMSSYTDVIDVSETPEGLWFSTFDHQNFLVTGFDDEVKKLDTSYVRYPDESGTIVHSDDIRLTQAFNLFYGEGWDGKCRRLDDGQFIAVDYSGNIIVNNQEIGNVCLGDSVVAIDGPNIYLDKDRSYYLDGEQLVLFEHGPIDRKVDVPDGISKFLWVSEYTPDPIDEIPETEVTIAAQADDTVYVVYNDGTVKTVASGVVDSCVAYDTLYYMVGDVVYALDWLNPTSKPEVFFNGAYAVSHHTDETEGAIVPEEKANYEGYGYSNLYSPYGTIEVPSAQQQQISVFSKLNKLFTKKAMTL